jgi:cobalt-zinc-cadmium efflux system membrane fusion protein
MARRGGVRARVRLAWTSLVLTAALGCHRSAPPDAGPRVPPGQVWLTPAEMARMHLEVATVGVHAIDDVLLTSGKVSFDDSRVTHVFSPVAGRITRIEARLGQRVRRRTPLARILSPEVGAASSDLDRAQSDLVAAELDLRRQRSLVEQGAASRRDQEQAQNTETRARAELLRARERMRLLYEGGLDRVTQSYILRAPIEGEVLALDARPGLELQGQYSSGGAVELFTIGELDRVWVLANLYEIDLPRVQLGARAVVRSIAYAEREFEGRVDWISGVLDPETRTARVRCTFDNPDRALRPEMFVSVAITVPPTRALAVPRESVLRAGAQTIVFLERTVSEDGRLRFERMPVTVDEGRRSGWVPVQHGLSAGDRVASAGAIQLLGMLSEVAHP